MFGFTIRKANGFHGNIRLPKARILKPVLSSLLLPLVLMLSHGCGDNRDSGTNGIDEHWTNPPIDLPNLSGTEYGAVGNNIAVDSKGIIYVLFTLKMDKVGRNILLTKSTDNGLTWDDPWTFSANSGFGWIGTIAVGPDDHLHVVWVEPASNAVHYANSADGGITWNDSAQVSGTPRFSPHSPQVSVDKQSRVHIAWHDGDTDIDGEIGEVYYRRSANNGAQWDEVIPLSPNDNQNSGFPRFNFQYTNGNNLAIAWRDERSDGDWDIYVAVSQDGGESWVEKVGADGAGDQWDPDLLVGPNDELHLGIMEYPLGVENSPTVLIHYSRSVNLGDSWTEPFQLVENRSRFPHLLYDGGADIIWFFTKDERDYVDPKNIYADIVAWHSLDAGETWSDMEFATDEGDNDVGYQGYAMGPDGTVHINYNFINHSSRDNTLKYIQRKRPENAEEDVPTESHDQTSANSSQGNCAADMPLSNGPDPGGNDRFGARCREVRPYLRVQVQ